MNRHYTIMIIPEHSKKAVSFRISRLFFRLLSFTTAVTILTLGILAYDYKQVIDQIYENKNLNVENRKLRDQLNIFQMKINTLSNDIQRIQIFEKKLRKITGLETDPDQEKLEKKLTQPATTQIEVKPHVPEKTLFQLQGLYQEKMATEWGPMESNNALKAWNELTKRSYYLANQFALFDFNYSNLKLVIGDLESYVHELDEFLLDKDSFLKSTPTLMPTHGWITSYYGVRTSPYTGRPKMHEGIDIGSEFGKNIIAPADGIVTYSGNKPGFGNFVQIDHGYGIETIFGHAKSLAVRNGQRVRRGELVAFVGSTGLSTGPHVHYEVRVNGIPVDPLYFILN